MGVLLGSVSFFLFLVVDFLVIRFGLPVHLYQFVIACAWISARPISSSELGLMDISKLASTRT